MVPSGVKATHDHLAQADVAGSVVLDVLGDVPPRQQSRGFRQLGCLAAIDRFTIGNAGLSHCFLNHGPLAAQDRVGRRECGGSQVGFILFSNWLTVPNPLEPGVLPEIHTACLAPPVPLTIAAYILEVHSVLHPPSAAWSDGVAGLVGTLEYADAPAAVLEHLGHERKSGKAPVFVQRRKNFFFAPDLNPIAP